jgi:hypothetical protein
MRCLLLRPVTLCSLLGCVVLVGCHHADRGCPTCGGQARIAANAAPAPAVASVPVSPYAGSPYAAVTPAPVVHEVLKTVPKTEPLAATRPEWQTVSGTVREKLLDRRTFTDLTVNPAFAHAQDYTWLVGELRSIGPDVWTVRFASVDDDRDTVVLVDAPPMNELRSGQLVRVEGQLVDPSSHEARPAFRVTAIRPAERN